MSETSSKRTINNLPEADLREFILGVVDGRILTANHLPGKTIREVFMPVVFGAFDGWTSEEMANIGTIYEYLSEAGPMAINGYPCFMSLRLLSKHDWEIALDAIKAEEERRRSIPIPGFQGTGA